MNRNRTNLVLAAVAVLAAALLALPGAAGAATSPWHVTPAPPLPGEASAVFCPAVTRCVVTGSYDDPGFADDDFLPLAWQESHGSWTRVALPLPAGGGVGILAALSCVSVSVCTAAGLFEDIGDEQPHALIERLSGGTWSLQDAALSPGTLTQELTGVSCRVADECIATGEQQYAGQDFDVPLAESWAGQSWGSQPVPLPAGGTSGSLGQVSCTAVNSCTAVGSYATTGPVLPMAGHWNGTAWTTQPTPLPAAATSGALTVVTCLTSTHHCIALGTYDTTAHETYGVAENRDGTTWTHQPLAGGGAGAVPAGLSCQSTAACVAIGFSGGPLAEEKGSG